MIRIKAGSVAAGASILIDTVLLTPLRFPTDFALEIDSENFK